jgi:hypothetical protein
MGFRDFHSFNLAMLSKQVWRLISDPNLLCARVPRATHEDILKAGPKAGSSFTWQSIMAGLATFKRGYIWRIGTGDNVDIFQDPWIPSSPDRRVLTPRGQDNLRKVNELIDPLTGIWDEGLLRHYFLPIDVNRILQIPLNTHGFDDFVA